MHFQIIHHKFYPKNQAKILHHLLNIPLYYIIETKLLDPKIIHFEILLRIKAKILYENLCQICSFPSSIYSQLIDGNLVWNGITNFLLHSAISSLQIFELDMMYIPYNSISILIHKSKVIIQYFQYRLYHLMILFYHVLVMILLILMLMMSSLRY